MATERLTAASRKWARKVIPAFKEKWPRMVKKAETYEKFVSGIAGFTGLSESSVRASIPAKEYKKFQGNPEAYVDKALRSLKKAIDLELWPKRYREAFRGA